MRLEGHPCLVFAIVAGQCPKRLTREATFLALDEQTTRADWRVGPTRRERSKSEPQLVNDRSRQQRNQVREAGEPGCNSFSNTSLLATALPSSLRASKTPT